MRQFLRAFFASLLALVVLLAVGAGIVVLRYGGETKIEDHSWLHIDLYGQVLEYDPPGELLSQVTGGDVLTLQQILENLAKAAVDDRIEGVIIQMSTSHSAGRAKLQEIRQAVQRVRAAGKPVLGYADTMNRHTYLLAAACDSLYLPPSAYVDFRGMSSSAPHFRGALEKLGIEPDLHVIRDYKAAAQLLTRDELSPAAERNRGWILDELWEMFCHSVQEDRGLTETQLIELMTHALFTAEEAVAAGLADGLLFWDELAGKLKRSADDHLRLVSHGRYAKEDPDDVGLKGGKKIAVVHAQGNIGGRLNGTHPLLGLMMGHETIAAELGRAAADDDVVAIVLRIDSGGGESLTSDLIGHAVAKAGRSKPVIVSMVDVAASGGYMVAYRGSQIIADPMTITGSIGSISGKFNLAGLYEKIGITHDHASRGPMALMDVSDRGFTPEEAARHADNHWQSFRAWMLDVALHRGIAVADIDSLCMGRTWTGRQAVANRLIDGLGDQHEAVRRAKLAGGLAEDANVTLWHLPERKGLMQLLLADEPTATQAARWAVHQALRRETEQALDLLNAELLITDPARLP